MSTTQRDSGRGEQDVSGWAVGGIAFAGTVMVMIGTFQVLEGLVAIFNDEFFVVARNYTFNLDVTAWGWIHLIIGVIALAIGIGLFYGKSWARGAGMGIAVLQAISQFMFLPHYPGWSLVIIALDVAVVWALATYRSDKFM
jgi:hypothetical protein